MLNYASPKAWKSLGSVCTQNGIGSGNVKLDHRRQAGRSGISMGPSAGTGIVARTWEWQKR